jgi:hypothetical protein
MTGLGLSLGMAEKPGQAAPQPDANAILLEDGTPLLAETGDALILES